MFMIKDVFWYNVDTKYNNYDNIYNYELKIHKYEEDLQLHKLGEDKNIREIIKKDPSNFQ